MNVKIILHFSLSNHALENDVAKTEIIYLIIIGCKTVLISSANINDRSMLYDKASEFELLLLKN